MRESMISRPSRQSCKIPDSESLVVRTSRPSGENWASVRKVLSEEGGFWKIISVNPSASERMRISCPAESRTCLPSGLTPS